MNQATTAPPPATTNTAPTINRREVAHRIFAAEFNASRFEVKGSADDRSPGYVITPLGAKANRILAVGVLTEVEAVGEAGDLHRARVSDPTGLFTLYAGKYQPEASAALAALQPPQYVAVVGKARTYEPEPGKVFVSIRPESITIVDETARDHWVLETARATRARIEATRSVAQLQNPTPDSTEKLGVPHHLVEGALLAREKYMGDVDLDYFTRTARDAVQFLVEGEKFVPRAPAQPQVASVVSVAPPKPKGPSGEIESKVLAIIQGLASSDEKGAQWDLIVGQGGKQGVTEDQVEEALNSLMDKGVVYEPILGRLKLA